MDHAVDIDETIKFRYNYEFTRMHNDVLAPLLYDVGGFRAFPYLLDLVHGIERGRDWHIEQAKKMLSGQIKEFAKEAFHKLVLGTMKLIKADPRLAQGKVSKYHNVVPLTLRMAFAQLTIGTIVTPTFIAKYLVLGTNSTTVTESDTQLGTETLRGLFTHKSTTGIVASYDKFFSSAEVAGSTFNEAGIVVDGTITPNTGYLFSHVNINEAMAAGETLTVNATMSVA